MASAGKAGSGLGVSGFDAGRANDYQGGLVLLLAAKFMFELHPTR